MLFDPRCHHLLYYTALEVVDGRWRIDMIDLLLAGRAFITLGQANVRSVYCCRHGSARKQSRVLSASCPGRVRDRRWPRRRQRAAIGSRQIIVSSTRTEVRTSRSRTPNRALPIAIRAAHTTRDAAATLMTKVADERCSFGRINASAPCEHVNEPN